jgi:uncharacterized protein (DUF952 family)
VGADGLTADAAQPIFHIALRHQWEAASQSGHYEADSLATEGFIHCSARHQILGVANRLFLGQRDLVLLRLEAGRLTAELRYEPGGGDVFPHIYGPINTDAVVQVIDFPARPDGAFDLPPELHTTA